MLVSTSAIVITKLKYGENDFIVTCYTLQFGMLSFLLRGVLKSKKGAHLTAYFQALSQVTLEIDYKPNRSLHTIKEVKLTHLYTSLHSNVIKSAVVMFLSEVLASTLREEEQNETLYSYLEHTLLWFDSHSEYSNFHLAFLLKLTKYLGFYPEVNHMEYDYFNLQDGKFESTPSNNYAISGENLELIKTLLNANFDTLSNIKINSKRRQSFLTMLLLYFELHLGSFKTPKSLQVLNQVFN
jgi:DNA repair protein RecO (recombination protein O)